MSEPVIVHRHKAMLQAIVPGQIAGVYCVDWCRYRHH
jgi:hypothetical protein